MTSQIEDDGSDAVAAQLSVLSEEVGQLRDLFNRRLLDDRARRDLYDRLYAELDFARNGLVRGHVVPLLRQLLLVIDGMDVTLDRADASERELTARMLDPVREQLLEVLAHQGVLELEVGEDFDAQQHEVIGVRPSDADRDGKIVAVRRPGYVLEDRLLRPAQVYVGRAAEDQT